MLRRSYVPAVALIVAALVPSAVRADEMLTFEKHVLPIFEKYCIQCHNLQKPKSGLDLTSLATARRGGDTRRGIVPGELEGSHIWLMLWTGQMPPVGAGVVSKKDKDTIKQWIEDGAKDDEQARLLAADKTTPQERLRAAVDRAAEALRLANPKMPERFEAPEADKFEEFNENIIGIQKEVGLLTYQLTNALEELRSLVGERNRSTRNWQAAADFTAARLQVRIAALGEYNYALGYLRKDPPRPDPKFRTGVKLVGRSQLTDRDSQKMANVAQRTLEKLIREQAGSRWELLGQRELAALGTLGLELQPFTDTKDRKSE